MSSRVPLNPRLNPSPTKLGTAASVVASSPAVDQSSRESDFRGFFSAHCAYIGRVALCVLSTTDELDDLVQDVFIIAYRHLHRLRDPKAARSWLATITVREGRRRLRRRKLRAVLGIDRDVAERPPPPDPSLDDEPRVLAAELDRELEKLPVNERLAWVLRIEGHPLPDVARLCGCSLATVKRRIDRAQRKLQKVFDDG